MKAPHPRTLYEKIWDDHVVADLGEGLTRLYVDLHLVNEVTSPQAFSGLRAAGLNFEGRQGPGGRTHLMSPAMVAAAAIEGCIADARDYLR